MLFTMGNLVTLGIVLIVLFLYRQLDRDNRSLEKVKKLGDRIQGDLDAYVNKRAEDLRGYGIELDVQQKAAKELLKRIQGVEEGLNARADGIGAVEKRLAEYDSVLARLMDMTARVDENLARIQEESEFTDTVAKKVEAASKSLVALEREIPGLRDDFARDNGAALEAYKETLLVDTRGVLAETRSLLDEARENAEGLLEEAQSARRDAEKEFVKAFERSRIEAEKLEDAAFEKLRAASEVKVSRLKETVEEKFAQIGQMAKDRAAETQALAKAFKTEWKAEAEALMTASKDDVARSAAELEARLASTDSRIASLAGAIDAAQAESGQRLLDAATDTESKLAEAARRADELATGLLEGAKTGVSKAVQDLAARLESAEAKSAAVGLLVEKRAAETESRAERSEAALADRFAELEKLAEEHRVALGERFAESLARADGIDAELDLRLAATISRAAEADDLLAARVAEAAKKTELLASGLGEKLKALLAAQREDFEKRVTDAKTAQAAALVELRSAVEAAREEGIAASRDLKAALAAAKIDSTGFTERLGREGEETALKVLAAVERRLDEYGAEVEGKFARLEAVNADIDILDSALRSSMADVGRKIEGDFVSFGRSLEERRRGFEETFGKETTGLRAAMRSLEEELAALKASAYENVSAQLKVFEDGFFADLNARKEASEASLAAWKAERDKSLTDLAARVTAERQVTEKGVLEEMRRALLDTQTRVFDQLEAIRSRADSIQTGIASEAKAAQDSIAALKEGLRRELAEAKKASEATLATELEKLSADSTTRIAATGDALGKRLSTLAAAIAAEEAQVRDTRLATSKASEEFRSGFGKALADVEARVRSDLEVWKRDTGTLIESLRADYEIQRDSWTAKSREERDRVQKELGSLAERSSSLRESLDARIAEALAGFASNYEEYVADQGRRSREATAEADEKLRAFRDAAQELSLKVEAARSQALGKIEAEAQRLAQTIAALDREQKNYVSQTKLFERSDELATRLGSSIESMKADLVAIESRRAEMAELEGQLARVKKLEDEVNTKVTRFLAEKKRVDSLEEGFARLASVSQGVDQRLAEITGQSDALTEAQTRIRKVLELSSEAESRYDRLEKKGQVIEATVEAVDKNFRSIADIEKTVAGLGAELKRLPERVQEIERSVSVLAAGKERADEAARRLGELDSVMGDVEKRIGEAQKVREWLARSETRLEEVNRQAAEQLKLLSTLLKEEGADKRGKGAPPSSVQDAVRKLARQGWNTDEIARAVKVSRGEVELILELGAKG